MFGLRSDPFCKQYQEWETSGQYKHDTDKKIYEIIKDNLQVLNSCGSEEQNLNRLKFNKDGRIELLASDQPGSRARKNDLKVFTQFVQRYFKAEENALDETEAREIQTAIESARDNTRSPAKRVLEWSKVPLSRDEVVWSARETLENAAKHVLRNEKIVSSGTKDEDLIVKKFNELQKKAAEENKKLKNFERRAFLKRIAPIVQFASIGFLVLAIPSLVFPPLAFAFLGLAAASLVGGFIGSRIANRLCEKDLKVKVAYDETIQQIKKLDDCKKRYPDPDFAKFLSGLPTHDFGGDIDKLIDLHAFYEKNEKHFKKVYTEPEFAKFVAELPTYDFGNDIDNLIRFHNLYVKSKNHYAEPEFAKFWNQLSVKDCGNDIDKLEKFHHLYEKYKKDYKEPEFEKFQTFLDQFPVQKLSLLADPYKLSDFHALYDFEKAEEQSVLLYEALRNAKKDQLNNMMNKHQQDVIQYRNKIVEIRKNLELPPRSFP